MYRIKYYDEYIYIPGAPDYTVLDPLLKREANKAGTLTFAILDTHPCFDQLEKLKFGIVVEDENEKILFKGRILDSDQNFDNEYMVTVAGKLSVLNDSPCRPYEFAGSPEELFDWFLENHNSQVNDEQKLKKGNVEVSDPNGYITRSWSKQEKTWPLMKSKLLDPLGGYLIVRYEADGDYLDWKKEFSSYSGQNIEFGENLLDLNIFIDASETYTMCIPYGAEIVNRTYEEVVDEHPEWQEDKYYVKPDTDYILIESEQIYNTYISEGVAIYEMINEDRTGERLTIESVNNGKDYIVNEELAEKYGLICAPADAVTWDDVTRPENLLKKASDWLNNDGIMFNSSVNLSSLDLSKLGVDIKSIDMYQNVRAFSAPHKLEASYLVEKMDLILNAPESLNISLGKSEKTLTDKSLDNKKKSEEALKALEESVDEKMDSETTAIRNEILERSSYILKSAEEITLGILAGHITTSELETYKKEIENLFKASKEGFSMEFNQLSQELDKIGGKISDQSQYIRFIEGVIYIGRTDSLITAEFTNDELSFMYNGHPVATFTSEALKVNSIYIENQLAYFDKWATRKGAYIEGKGYNLTDMWIGG